MENKYILKELNKVNLMDLLGYKIESEFKLEQILNPETLNELGLNFGIIYNFDSVDVARIKKLKIDMENIIEARFFNEEKEIKIFRDENKVKGTIFIEGKETRPIKKIVILEKRGKSRSYPSKLKFKKYIDYDDEDNQAYVRYVKPCNLYFEEDSKWSL